MINEKIKFTIDKYSPDPVYVQLKKQIKDYIQINNLPGGSKIPSLQAIAKTAGVSLRTAERGVTELIKENICYRRPKTGTYVSDVSGIPTKQQIFGIVHHLGENVIGNIIHDTSMLYGIRKHAEKKGINTLFISNKSPETDIYFFLQNSGIDFKGLFIFDIKGLESTIPLAKRFPDLKIVCLNYYHSNFQDTPNNIYGVFNDEFAGAYRMTEHLISQGHKRIGFLSIELIDENYRDRLKGYRCALEDNNIKYDQNRVIEAPQKQPRVDPKEIGAESASEMLERDPEITAIFSSSDKLAAGALNHLKAIGLDNNITVAGHDNTQPEISRENNFSTVSVDFTGIGEKAAEIVTSTKNHYPKIIRVTPQLIMR